MKYKILSLCLCLTGVLSMLVPLTAAETTNRYNDYIPGEKPANMLINPAAIDFYVTSNSGRVSKSYDTAQKTITYSLSEEGTGASNAYHPIHGTFTPKDKSYGFNGKAFESGADYVVAMKIKNMGTTVENPVFGVGFWSSDAGGNVSKPFIAENVTEKSEWQEFKSTLHVDYGGNDAIVMIGYPWQGAVGGSEVTVSYADTYIAKEVAYDISNEVISGSANSLKGGDTLRLSATVLNQIGDIGNLSQNFSWYALAYDRTTVAEDIVFLPSDDSTTATVTLKDDIANGIYYIAAVSKDYPELIKTVKLVVGSAVSEFQKPDRTENLILLPASADFYSTSNNGKVSKEYTQTTAIYTLEDGALPLSNSFPIHGTYTDNTRNSFKDVTFESGKNYVFFTKLRNAGTTIESPTFGFALSSSDGTQSCMPSATTTVSVTDSWQEFSGSLHVEHGGDTASVMIGFPTDGAEEGSKVELLMAETYLAEEQKYDITADISGGNRPLLNGDTVEVSAAIINQLGQTGSLAQGFTWTVLDESKIGTVSGFEINISDDTKSAAITVGDTVPLGTYYIAVKSNNYAEMVRTIEIKVKQDMKLYVSSEIDGESDGSFEHPFKTLESAKAAVAQLDKENFRNIDIILRGGDYRISEPLEFTSADSGRNDLQITYKSFEGEKAVIKDSVILDGTKAKEVLNAELLARMHPEVHRKVVVFDLAEQGITADDICDVSDVASFYALKNNAELNSVYIDGVEQTLSQWPNDRIYAIRGGKVSETSFYYTDSEPDRWAQAKSWYIGTFLPYDYSYARISGSSVDIQNNIINLAAGGSDFAVTDNFSKRWKAFNLLEEIDMPGEYYIDRENLKLYLYPPYDLENARIEFSKSGKAQVVFSNAHDIAFSDIAFAQTRGNAIEMRDVDNVDIKNCSFVDISGVAISVSGTALAETNKNYWQRQQIDGSYNVDISGCTFSNIGSSAIHISGGNVDTLKKSNNIIENNFVYNTCTKTLSLMNGAISAAGCGNVIRHNHIALSPGPAILLNGNDHLIEYNEIYEVLLEVADSGAIYQGRNQVARGSVVQYNYLHDMVPTQSLSHSAQVAIYWDDCQQGLTAQYNIIRNVKIDLNSNGAGAITHKNNTSIDVDRAWSFLNHASTATKTVDVSCMGTVQQAIDEINNQELYFEKYSDLAKWADTDRKEGNNAKLFTVIEENLAVNAAVTGIEMQDRFFATISGNKSLTDEAYSMFVNPTQQDYRVKNSSPLAQEMPDILNESFDIEQIGLQKTFTLNTENSGFKQIHPNNGQTVKYTEDGVTFSWQNAFGATKYRLVVATDSEFKNPVYNETVRFHSQTVSSLENNTTYYWKVEAENTSRELASVWKSENSGSSFSLASYVEEVSLSDTSMDVDGNEIFINTTVTNNALEENPNAMISVAVYDSNNALCDIKIFSTKITNGEDVPIECYFDTKGLYTAEKIVIFVWESGTIRPFRKCRILR